MLEHGCDMRHLQDRLGRESTTVFLTALPDVARQTQLETALQRMREQLGDPWMPERIDSWAGLLRLLLGRASAGPLAVVLDEVPYLVDSDS